MLRLGIFRQEFDDKAKKDQRNRRIHCGHEFTFDAPYPSALGLICHLLKNREIRFGSLESNHHALSAIWKSLCQLI